jgi:hypothetical protein
VRPEVILRTLPGVSIRFCDFMEGAEDVGIPSHHQRGLPALAEDLRPPERLARQSISSLRDLVGSSWEALGTVDEAAHLVLGIVPARPLGGPLSILYKALTVVRLAQELRNLGVEAAPLVLVSERDGSDSRPALCSLDQAGNGLLLPEISGAETTAELSQHLGIEEDSETAMFLAGCYGAGRDLCSGTATFLSALMEPWGCPVVPAPRQLGDDGIPPAGRRAPPAGVAAMVVDAGELDDARRWAAELSDLPVFWPAVSATLLDSRARKALDRYGLEIADTCAGADALIGRLGYLELAPAVLGKMSTLQAKVAQDLAGLGAAFADDPKLGAGISEAVRGITYQLDRLRERFEPAAAQRLDSARRQLGRLCNFAAPGGRVQEATLATFYVLHRFSSDAVLRIGRGLDPAHFDHQILMLE